MASNEGFEASRLGDMGPLIPARQPRPDQTSSLDVVKVASSPVRSRPEGGRAPTRATWTMELDSLPFQF
ncbi:hypothetical protein TgHK011_001434 [Trichoderma gracile]|nr:hypothetical protein TgHK011_001434 [Trichoderma gracile]